MTFNVRPLGKPQLSLEKRGSTLKYFVSLFAGVFLLASCTDGFTEFPVHEDGQGELEEQLDVVRLSSKNIETYTLPSKPVTRTRLPYRTSWSYAIGVGDVLSIDVYDHPELTMPAGPDRSARENGFRVQADGKFFYPHIGEIDAKGRTIEQVRSDLSQKLRQIIPEPQVVARIAEFKSQSVLVGGEVNSPNKQTLDTVPLTLFQAVNAAGGATEEADLSRITVKRNGHTYRVDLNGFLRANYAENNPILRAGDVVHVPELRTEQAYILGEVSKPSVVDLAKEPINLTQALANQGGLKEVRADARGVFVFRNHSGRTTVFQLETSSPEGWLLGTEFSLIPDDVVYVTRSPLTRWNDTITALLPTVVAIRNLDDLSEL